MFQSRALIFGESSLRFFGRKFSSAASKNSYKSPYSIDSIYPPDQQKKAAEKSRIPTGPSPKEEIFNGFIPVENLKISRGILTEGKKTAQAEIRFNLSEAKWIPAAVRQRLGAKFPHRLSKDGDFVVRSDRTTVGSLNVADCLDKLRNSLWECVDEIRTKSPKDQKQPSAKDQEGSPSKDKIAASPRDQQGTSAKDKKEASPRDQEEKSAKDQQNDLELEARHAKEARRRLAITKNL